MKDCSNENTSEGVFVRFCSCMKLGKYVFMYLYMYDSASENGRRTKT